MYSKYYYYHLKLWDKYNNMKLKKGFTLLEMIIVISVLSILFLLTVPNIQKVLNVVEHKGCKALLKVVDAAILQFKLDYNEYPNDISDLVNANYLSEDQIECANDQSIYIVDNQASIK